MRQLHPKARLVTALLALTLVSSAALGAGVRTAATPPTTGTAKPPAPPPTVIPSLSTLFEFHSGLWMNLHHFLYVQARARKGTPDAKRPSVAGAATDTIGLGKLSPTERKGWNAALDYYEKNLAERDLLFDSTMVVLKNQLALAETQKSLAKSGIDPKLAAILEGAAPAYEHIYWRRHDNDNREWQGAVEQLLLQYESTISMMLSRAYKMPWPKPNARVDLTAYANWAGAYTTIDPAHLTVGTLAPGNQENYALEVLLHEASHTMADSVEAGIRRAAEAQGKPVPPDLWHAVLFYTAGVSVKRAIPDHVPYAEKYGLWDRGPMPSYKKVLTEDWDPYLNGKATFQQAIDKMITDL